MQGRGTAGGYSQTRLEGAETRGADSDDVLAQRDRAKLKCTLGIRWGGLEPLGGASPNVHLRAANGTELGILNRPPQVAKNSRRRCCTKEKKQCDSRGNGSSFQRTSSSSLL